MYTVGDRWRQPRGIRWLVALLLPAALACGGGGGSQPPGPPAPGPTSDVTMPPTAAGDPAAPWTRAAPAALVADPGPDRTVDSAAHVLLDGTRSTSPAGAITGWSWESIGATTVALTGAATPHPRFDAPVVTSGAVPLTFALTVVDGTGASTTATQQVLVHEPAAAVTTSSVGVVHRAMQDGSLDRDTAAQYLAFAAFGDPRLPAGYRGARAGGSISWAVHHLAREYASLSTAAQSVVLPFLLPPGHPAREAGLPPAAAAGVPLEQRGVEGTHVAVWYWTDLVNGHAVASNLVDEIETKIWPKLQEVWHADHMPVLNDAGIGAGFRGTHGKLNIFLDRISRDAGLSDALGYESSYGDDSQGWPAFVVLRQNLPWSSKDPMGLIQCAAHEITHACQDSFKHAESYAKRRLLYEGIAMWAIDDVYPAVDAEHPYASSLLDRPWLPLDDESDIHPYGAYLFFQWATRPQNDRDFVRRAFVEFQTRDSLAAIDNAFPSYGEQVIGLEFNWGSFLEAIWNRDDGKYFRANDRLTAGAKHAETRTLAVGGSGDADFVMEAEVPYLSGRYHHFVVDPGVRTISFYDGLTNKLKHKTATDGSVMIVTDATTTADEMKGATTRMLVKRAGAWTGVSLLPGAAGFSLCQDDPAEAVEEIAIAFGDSYPRRGHSQKPRGLLPTLWVTNIGCFQWRGSATMTTTDPNAPTETITVSNAIFTPYAFGGVKLPAGTFQALSGSVSWSIGGTVNGCTYSGSGAFAATGMGFLVFAPEILLGGKYRTYTGTGSNGPNQLTYTMDCGSGPTVHTRNIEWLKTNGTGTPPSVSADGAQAAGSYDDGHHSWSWTFQREAGIATP